MDLENPKRYFIIAVYYKKKMISTTLNIIVKVTDRAIGMTIGGNFYC